MVYPAQVKIGDTLQWRGVSVRIINVDGQNAMIRLASGDWAMCPLAELSPTDITAGTRVHSGPIGEKVSGTEFAKRVLMESFRRSHPALEGMLENGATIIMDRGPLPPGTVLLHKASRTAMTLISHSTERDLYVAKAENGELGVFSSAELVKGDGSDLEGSAHSLHKSASNLNRGTRVRARKTGRIGTIMTDGHSVSSVIEYDGSGSLEAIRNEELELI